MFCVYHMFSCIFCSMNFWSEKLKMHSEDKPQGQKIPADRAECPLGPGEPAADSRVPLREHSLLELALVV